MNGHAPLTLGELDFLHGMLDLARTGQTTALSDAVGAGLPVNLTNSAGDSLLILAAYHCHPDTVNMLLDYGADPDRVNDRGQTALAAAVFRRDRRIVDSLLAGGADAAAGERSALQIAQFFHLAEMADLIARSVTPAPGPISQREDLRG